MRSTDRVEKVEKVETTHFNPSKGGRERVEKVERLYSLNLSNPSHHGPTPRAGFRESAAQYLPEFTPDARLLQSVFAAKVWATTPDGSWGDEPDWHRFSWPCVRGDEFGPPIQPATELAKQSKGRRK